MDLNDALTMPVSQFRDIHLGKLPLFSKVGQAERLKSVEEALGPLEPAKLIQRLFPREPLIYLPDDPDDPYLAKKMPPAQALSLYNAGAGTLSFEAHALPEWVKGYLEHIPNSLPSSAFFFASRRGGLGAHFDHLDVLSIQVVGTRTWSLWSPTISDPTTPLAFVGQPSNQLAYAMQGVSFPPRLPEKPTMEVTMEPGSILYVPRGWWHAAAAGQPGETSMHMTVIPNAKNSLDVMTEAVVAALSRHRYMRAPLSAEARIDWDEVARDLTRAVYELRDAHEEPSFEQGVAYRWSRTAFCYTTEENGDKPAMLKCGKFTQNGTEEFESPLSDTHRHTLLAWLKQETFVPTDDEQELAGVLTEASIIVRAT